MNKPGRAFDRKIAEHVFKYMVVDKGMEPGDDCFYYKAPPGTCGKYCVNHEHMLPEYSTDFASAWPLVDWVMDREWLLTVHIDRDHAFSPMILKAEPRHQDHLRPVDRIQVEVIAKTLPFAICEMALQVAQHEN